MTTHRICCHNRFGFEHDGTDCGPTEVTKCISVVDIRTLRIGFTVNARATTALHRVIRICFGLLSISPDPWPAIFTNGSEVLESEDLATFSPRIKIERSVYVGSRSVSKDQLLEDLVHVERLAECVMQSATQYWTELAHDRNTARGFSLLRRRVDFFHARPYAHSSGAFILEPK